MKLLRENRIEKLLIVVDEDIIIQTRVKIAMGGPEFQLQLE